MVLFNKNKLRSNSILVTSLITSTLLLANCGGGSGGGNNTPSGTATGQFKDSNTAGLHYISGERSGTTDASGTFTYQQGSSLSFSIGGVNLGTLSDGKSIVTPIDLVSNSNSSTTEVRNIVRFLLMLDEDGDPDNGISISDAVQTAAQGWPQVDFSTADLATELSTIISEAMSADGGTHTLPNNTDAQAHLESTLSCAYSGAFRGTFSGDDSGEFGFALSASSHEVEGVAISNTAGQLTLIGDTPIDFVQNPSFASVTGTTSNDASFSGIFNSVNSVSGNWDLGIDSGTFSGARIGGAADAQYRFTGRFTGDDNGLFSFDIDENDMITGVAYSVPFDEISNITGSLSGTTIEASTDQGTSIDGNFNKITGILSDGTWDNGIENGTYSGSGCKLN